MSPTDTQPLKLCAAELDVAMASLGFRGRRQLFCKQISDETVFWTTLQILKGRKPFLGLFPRIGVTNRMVNQFLHTVLQESVNPSLPVGPASVFDIDSGITATLGYLMPPPLEVEWYCDSTQPSIHALVEKVVGRVDAYGLPFMKRFVDLPGFRAWAEDPEAERDALPLPSQPGVLRAAIFVLTGDTSRARDIMTTSIAECLQRGETLDEPGAEPMLRMRDYLFAA